MNTKPNTAISQDHKNPNDSNASRGAFSFLLISFLFLIASALWIAIKPGLFLEEGITAQSKAWTYLTLYGFALPAVFGLVYRSLPTAFAAPLLGESLLALHWAFHMFGFGLVLANAFQPEGSQPVMGQTFIACGVVVFVVNTGVALHRRGLAEPSSAFLAVSLLWIVIASLIGLPLSGEPLLAAFKNTQWSAATLELCLLGFVLNGILGLALRLTSLRLANDPPRTESSWFALAFTNAGLAWLFAAITHGPPSFVIVCLAVYMAGILIFLMRHLAITQQRRVEVLDWDTKILLTALWVIPAAIFLAGWAAWIRLGNPEEPLVGLEKATVLTTVLAVAVPALVALAYQSEAILRGLDPDEPTAHLRLSSQVLLASFFNYATGVCLFLGGVAIGAEKMLSLGAIFSLVGVLGFFGNFLYARREKNALEAIEAKPA